MILIAVIVGYLLGIAPYIYKEVKEILTNRNEEKNKEEEKNTAEEIFNEWLNGANEKNVNQEDLFKEYTTGEVTKGVQ
nr:MAG TPA: hypothetical protein [Caudoviricetes sp.]